MIERLEEFLARHLEQPWQQALALVVIGMVAAVVLDRLLTLLLKVFGRRTRTDLDDALIEALHRPVILTVVLGAMYRASLLSLEERLVDEVTGTETLVDGNATVSLFLLTILVLTWLGFLLRASGLLLQAAARNSRVRLVQPTSLPLFSHAAKVALLALGVFVLLRLWEVDATGWLASAGILGIVVGLAAQDSLANLFAGAFILADGPYKIGDYVVLDTGERGMVTAIGLRSTRLLTRDDIEIIIPNSVMGAAKIINETGGPVRAQRLRLKVAVAYSSEVPAVRGILMEAAAAVSLVKPDPAPRVRFRMFGDSGLHFELLCWVPEAALRGQALDQLNEEVHRRFRDAGVEIPYPQRDLHLRTFPDSLASSLPTSGPPS